MPKVFNPQPTVLKPYWKTKDSSLKLYHGDVIEVLNKLPEQSVQMCVTSPPYWNLRDYGTAEWEGGSDDCNHVERTAEMCHKTSTLGSKKSGHPVTNAAYQAKITQYKHQCKKCGAKRTDQQIGSEKTLEEFVTKMVEVFREVRRVLRNDGTCWINLGDNWNKGVLQLAPHRVAIALGDDGWVIRQDIVWAKTSPMPESCKNRCTKSHEYIFLLTKKAGGYYYDQEAIREEAIVGRSILPNGNPRSGRNATSSAIWRSVGDGKEDVERGVNTKGAYNDPESGRNKWSVWTSEENTALIEWLHENNSEVLEEYVSQEGNKLSKWLVSSVGYPGSHFATFAPDLIEPTILAGSKPGDVVLDPFVGSGTTLCVAMAHDRHGIGIDLSETYLKNNAIPRIEGALMSRPGKAHLAGRTTEKIDGGKRLC